MNYKKIIDIPSNHIGYDNAEGILSTILGLKVKLLALSAFTIGGVIGFVEKWIWKQPEAVLILLIIVGIDFLTGIISGIVAKDFKSKKLVRTAGKIFTYMIMLFISYNIDKYVPFIFSWFPMAMLSVFYATEAWSIIENLSSLGLLNKEIVEMLKSKLSLKNITKSKEGGENSEVG